MTNNEEENLKKWPWLYPLLFVFHLYFILNLSGNMLVPSYNSYVQLLESFLIVLVYGVDLKLSINKLHND